MSRVYEFKRSGVGAAGKAWGGGTTPGHIILFGSVLNRVGTGLKQGLSPRSLISL